MMSTTTKNLTFKNNAPFRSCVSKIIDTFVDNTEDNKILNNNTTKNNNLGYITDQTFRNTNRLFALSLKNGDNDPKII